MNGILCPVWNMPECVHNELGGASLAPKCQKLQHMKAAAGKRKRAHEENEEEEQSDSHCDGHQEA